LEICIANQIPFEEREFTLAEMLEMDELIIAGTGSEVTPAIKVDSAILGNGKPGKITRFIQGKFFELV